MKRIGSGTGAVASNQRFRNLIAFIATTVMLSLPCWWAIHAHPSAAYFTFLMWAPALAAFLVIKLTGGTFVTLGWRGTSFKWAGTAWLFTTVSLIVTYSSVFLLGLVHFPDSKALDVVAKTIGLTRMMPVRTLVWYFVLTSTAGTVRLGGPALGEEIGWRGYLTSEACQRMGFTWGSIFVGCVWAAWHLPLMVGHTPISQIVYFELGIIGMSVSLSWFRLKSCSVWPSVLMHAVHNAIMPGFFVRLASPGPSADLWMDETGRAFAILGLASGVSVLLVQKLVSSASTGGPSGCRLDDAVYRQITPMGKPEGFCADGHEDQ